MMRLIVLVGLLAAMLAGCQPETIQEVRSEDSAEKATTDGKRPKGGRMQAR